MKYVVYYFRPSCRSPSWPFRPVCGCNRRPFVANINIVSGAGGSTRNSWTAFRELFIYHLGPAVGMKPAASLFRTGRGRKVLNVPRFIATELIASMRPLKYHPGAPASGIPTVTVQKAHFVRTVINQAFQVLCCFKRYISGVRDSSWPVWNVHQQRGEALLEIQPAKALKFAGRVHVTLSLFSFENQWHLASGLSWFEERSWSGNIANVIPL